VAPPSEVTLPFRVAVVVPMLVAAEEATVGVVVGVMGAKAIPFTVVPGAAV
jgi:hypothetical protein